MFIDFVEIENFKSFNGFRNIGPFNSLNSIVGPNGSGKSNIIDAILFCYGDTSRRLRVERLTDLIHAPPWIAHRPTFCSVKVIVKLSKYDETQTFYRRINVNGSEVFKFNEIVLSKKDYLTKIESYGLLTRFDNCTIRQGSIELMLSNNSENRTKLLNAISGADKFAAEYVKLEEVLKENAQSLEELRVEMSRGRKENRRLTEAKTKRTEIDAEKDKLKQMRVNCYLLEAYPIVQAREKALHDHLIEQQNIVQTADKNVLIEDFNLKKSEASAKTAFVKEVTEKVEKLKAEKKEVSKKIDDLKISLDHATKKARTAGMMAKAAENKARERDATIARINQKINELEAQHAESDSQSSQQSSRSLSQTALDEYNKLKSKFENAPEIENVSLATDALDSLTYRLSSLTTSMELMQEKLKAEKRALENISGADADENRFTDMQNQIDALEKELEEIRLKKIEFKKLTKTLEKVNIEYNDAMLAMEHQREMKLLDVIDTEILEQFKGKVFGRFRKLITITDKKYYIAASRGCFSMKDAFVVDTAETAAKCIDFLRDKRHFVQTFLAADSLVPSKRIDNAFENAVLLRDVVIPRTDANNDAVNTAIQFVCSNVVVCDTDTQATALSYPDTGRGLTTVTLDGTLLKPGGVIAGGVQASNKNKVLQTDIEHIISRKATVKAELEKLEAAIQGETSRMSQIETLKSAMQQLSATHSARIESKQGRINELKASIDVLEVSRIAKEIEITDVKQNIVKAEAALKEAQELKQKVHENIFAQFCAVNKITDLKHFEKDDLKFNENRIKEQQELNAQIEKLKSEIQYLRNANTDTTLTIIQPMTEIHAEKLNIENRINELRPHFEKLCADLDEIQLQLDSERSILAELQKSASNAKKALRDFESTASKITQLTAKYNDTNAKLLHQLKTLFIQCSSNELELPLNNCEFSNIDFFETEESSESEENRKVPISAVEINFTNVLQEIRSDKMRIAKHLAYKKDIERVEKELRLMSAGVITVEDYNNRLFTSNELRDAQTTKYYNIMTRSANARKDMFALGKKRCESFTTAFRHFCRKLSFAYKTLYRNNHAQTFLDLDNDDEPYKSRIRFECIVPGKNRRPFELLSGGEQSMAHLAFMIASRSKNVQFIVLDELDAALDRKNILLAKHFLRELASKGDQIIAVSHRQEIYSDGIFIFGAFNHCLSRCQLGTTVISLDMNETANIELSKEDKKRQHQGYITEITRMIPRIDDAIENTESVADEIVSKFIGNINELNLFIEKCNERADNRCNNSAAITSLENVLKRFHL